MEYAFYRKEAGKEPTMMDLIQELDVFCKQPIRTAHETMMQLWERGELEGGPQFDAALTTLWAALMNWERLENSLRNDSREARGLSPLEDFYSSAEDRMVNDMAAKIAMLDDDVRAEFMNQVEKFSSIHQAVSLAAEV